ncbi:hypothetical protein pipiens_016591 [Culex pipiens pipiens]|uniref:Uncharacterized protein n=1 Tax=Culex pipiens pipiens TaxID=38569 RepID=A0ABD1CKL5_CULPP
MCQGFRLDRDDGGSLSDELPENQRPARQEPPVPEDVPFRIRGMPPGTVQSILNGIVETVRAWPVNQRGTVLEQLAGQVPPQQQPYYRQLVIVDANIDDIQNRPMDEAQREEWLAPLLEERDRLLNRLGLQRNM